MARRKRRSFTPEYKAEAVRLVQVGDRSVREVAKALDLTETALREWTKAAAVDAGEGHGRRAARRGDRGHSPS